MFNKTAPPPAEPAAPLATPENTPLPGGGRWMWDATLPGWAEVTEPAAEPVATPSAPLTESNLE